MRLYYTTSVKENDPQADINLSIGGYKSMIPVRKSSLNNFFSDITEYSKENSDRKQYIALILKNETGQDVHKLQLWFERSEGCYSQIKVAAIDLTNGATERVADIYDEPLYIDQFIEAEGADHFYDMGDLIKDGEIAIWLERSILKDVINQRKLYEKVDEYLFKEVTPETEDSIKMVIHYMDQP